MNARKSAAGSASARDEAEKYYAEIREDRNFASKNLSTQIRSTVLAILALTWLLLAGTDPKLGTKFGCFSNSLMWLAAICVGALVADFLHGVCAVHETNKAANESADALSESRYDDVGYDEKRSLREASTIFYVVKCVLVVIAAIWLIVLIYRALAGACVTVCG